MDEKGIDMSSATSGGPPSSSRWNPTKEQISVLEGLYKQGIRTPSAEQIQQITSSLREYGHIEGKNVFYWFQNHKARQRQKQKQESMVYFNNFFNSSTPTITHPLPPPCSNVICGPYCIPQPTVGFYPRYPKVLLPGGVRRSIGDRDKVVEKVKEGRNVEFESGNPVRNNMDTMDHETLQLFPLHPTGLVEERSPSPSVSTEACNLSFDAGTGTEERNGEQIFFNFFADSRSCERE